MFKHNQKVEVEGTDMDWKETWEAAKIVKPRGVNLPVPAAGYHLVKFSDGGKLYIHETRLRAA